MTQPTLIAQDAVFQGGGAVFLARIIGYAGALVTQATFSSISCSVFDLNGASITTPIITPSIVISAVIFNSLQTDASWTLDNIGYNFAHQMPVTAFPIGAHRYRVEYKFVPVTGAVFWLAYECLATRLLTLG